MQGCQSVPYAYLSRHAVPVGYVIKVQYMSSKSVFTLVSVLRSRGGGTVLSSPRSIILPLWASCWLSNELYLSCSSLWLYIKIRAHVQSTKYVLRFVEMLTQKVYDAYNQQYNYDHKLALCVCVCVGVCVCVHPNTPLNSQCLPNSVVYFLRPLCRCVVV